MVVAPDGGQDKQEGCVEIDIVNPLENQGDAQPPWETQDKGVLPG